MAPKLCCRTEFVTNWRKAPRTVQRARKKNTKFKKGDGANSLTIPANDEPTSAKSAVTNTIFFYSFNKYNHVKSTCYIQKCTSLKTYLPLTVKRSSVPGENYACKINVWTSNVKRCCNLLYITLIKRSRNVYLFKLASNDGTRPTTLATTEAWGSIDPH